MQELTGYAKLGFSINVPEEEFETLYFENRTSVSSKRRLMALVFEAISNGDCNELSIEDAIATGP